MTFAKFAADELVQPELLDEHNGEPVDDTDRDTQQAKKDHWKKWLAALGILGGVGAAGYYGWKNWRPAMENIGVVPKPDPIPPEGTPENLKYMAQNGTFTPAQLGGGMTGALAPLARFIPSLARWIPGTTTNQNRNFSGIHQTALDASSATPSADENNAHAAARRINEAVGGKENLAKLTEELLNAPGNKASNPINLQTNLDPMTAAVRGHAQIHNRKYQIPGVMDVTKALRWFEQNPNATTVIGGEVVNNAAIREKIKARTGQDVTGSRLAKGYEDVYNARPRFALTGKGLLGHGASAWAGGAIADAIFPRKQLAKP